MIINEKDLTLNDKNFLDTLYAGFSRTTHASDAYWGYEDKGGYNLFYVAQDAPEVKHYIGVFDNEADADFITAVHGCLPDLVRRLHDALDEADRLDRERDEAEQNVFRLAIENEELRAEAAQLRRERESWVSRAGDTLWKIERPM